MKKHTYGLKSVSPVNSFRAFRLSESRTLDVPDTDLTPMFIQAGIKHKDQGDVGCCVFASGTTCAEFLTYKQTGEPLNGFQYSMYFPYYYVRKGYLESGEISSISDDCGATSADFMKAAKTVGFCHERTWKSIKKNYAVEPSKVARTEALDHQALESFSIQHNSVTLIRAVLYHEVLPVQAGIIVPPELESEKVEKTGILDEISDYTLSNNLGAHEIVVVGSTSINGHKYFRVRNSWGEDWGVCGDFYIPQSLFSKLCVEARVMKKME